MTGRMLRVLLAAALALAPATALISVLARPYIHDEPQHVVPAILLVREGLLPYADFPHYHTPYQVFANAVAALATDRVYFAARLAQAAWALAGLALLGVAVARAAPLRSREGRWIAIACVVLVASAKSFVTTAGVAWNQSSSATLALGAALLVASAARRASIPRFAAAGALLGLAIGTRLTWAPLALALAAGAVLLEPRGTTRRRLLALAAGAGAALLPAALLAARAPASFWYGNLLYGGHARAYHTARGLDSGLLARLGDVLTFWTLRPHMGVPLLVGLLAAGWTHWRLSRERGLAGSRPLLYAFLAFGATCLGAYATPRIHVHYSYGPVLFGAWLFGAAAAAAVRNGASAASIAHRATLLAVAAAALGIRHHQVYDEPPTAGLSSPAAWVPNRVHALGQALAERVPGGRVLALQSLAPLLGGLRTYPQFANGPFAWRTGGSLPPVERRALGVVTADELDALLADAPPDAVLTGLQWRAPHIEDALRAWALRNGYEPEPVGPSPEEFQHPELWVRPR